MFSVYVRLGEKKKVQSSFLQGELNSLNLPSDL